MRNLVKRSALVIIVGMFFLGLTMIVGRTMALSEEELVEYSLNDIMFYQKCPTDGGSNEKSEMCGITVRGSTIEEKIWSGLTSFMSEEQAAGVMGNMKSESGFGPARHENGYVSEYPTFDLTDPNHAGIAYGIGLIQWSRGRRIELGNYLKEKANELWTKYIDEGRKEYGGLVGADFLKKAGDDDTNNLIAAELCYMKKEFDENPTYAGVLEKNTVQEATDYFLERVEVPADIEGTRPGRRKAAQEFYNQFHGKSISNNYNDRVVSTSTSGGGSSSSGSSGVGGNAKKISDTAIKLAWPENASASDYKESYGGRPTDAIMEAWEQLGTKDRNLSHGADCGWFVQAVVAASGADPDYTEATKGDPNLKLEEYAKEHPEKWEIIDFSDGDTSKLQAGDAIMSWSPNEANAQSFHGWVIAEVDGKLHDVQAGYCDGGCGFWGHVDGEVGDIDKVNDEQIILRVKGGPSCDSCEKGSMNINGAAVCLAWPLGTEPSKSDYPAGSGTELFNEFWDQEEGVYKGNSLADDCWIRGAYCCGFVSAAVRFSGYDPNFSSTCDAGDNLGGGANQYLYVKNHLDLWELIPWNGDKSVLKGGDIIYYSGGANGHTYLIVQDEKGELYIAEASMCGFFGRISEYRAPPLGSESFIYRAKNAMNSNAGVSVTDGVEPSSRTGKLTGGTGQGNGDINTTAFDLAWPEDTPASTSKAKAWDKFVEAFNSLPGRKNTGGQTWKDGKSCMVFVNTVLNYAGALSMDKLSSVTWNLIESADWEEVGGEGNDGKGLTYGDLEPGDVLAYFASGASSDGSAQYKGLGLQHEAIYGETPDGEGRIIESHFEAQWGHVAPGKLDPKDEIAGGWAKMVRVFRWKKQSGGDECDICAGSDDSGGQLKAGGFDTVEEATKFMQSYIDAASPGGKYWMVTGDVRFGVKNGRVHDAGCPNGVLHNCVSFSQWFVNNYTTVGPDWNNTTNGVDLVDALVKQGLKRGTEPRPYAIFSKRGPSTDGHTGVIFGVNTSTKKVIVGDAACNQTSGQFYKPRAYELSFDEIKDWWYAYTDDKLSMGGPLRNA